MTEDQIRDLAREAAEAAMDAHTADTLPPAAVALEFIVNMRYEAEIDADPLRLTAREFDLFLRWYLTFTAQPPAPQQ